MLVTQLGLKGKKKSSRTAISVAHVFSYFWCLQALLVWQNSMVLFPMK